MKRTTIRWRFLAFSLLFALICSCFSVVNTQAASDFTVKKGVLIRYSGKKTKVTIPKGTVCSKFTYKSNKSKIAAVSKTGKITAKKKGTAKVTVTAGNNKKAKATITVKVK